MRKRSELIQSVMDYVISEIKYLSPTNVEKILAVWDDMEDDELVENLCNLQNLYHSPGQEPTKQVLQGFIKKNRIIMQEKFKVFDVVDNEKEF